MRSRRARRDSRNLRSGRKNDNDDPEWTDSVTGKDFNVTSDAAAEKSRLNCHVRRGGREIKAELPRLTQQRRNQSLNCYGIKKERKKFMKKSWIFLMTMMMVLALSGCGQEKEKTYNVAPEESTLLPKEEDMEQVQESGAQKNGETEERAGAQEAGAVSEQENDTAIQETQEQETDTEGAQDSAQDAEASGDYEDNFAVDTATAAAFGRKIKEAVADKDIEKLADLTIFPVYVGLTEEGAIVETREDFIALGAEALFTEEMVNSIEGADESGLSPSMAGFTLYSEDGAPSITFGVQEGKLGIKGINY